MKIEIELRESESSIQHGRSIRLVPEIGNIVSIELIENNKHIGEILVNITDVQKALAKLTL